MSGWIKLHRSIQNHFIYDFSEPDKALAWIDILLSASYSDSKVKIKSKVIPVQKGQWLVSQVTLQKRWKMSQNKVKRLLNMLENDGMICVLTNELTSVITICNFSNYQDGERANEQPVERAVERGTNEQSNDIQRSKELQEVKEVKKKNSDLDFSSWPCLPSQQIFNDWIQVRKAKKAAVTQTAINRIGKQLHKAVAAGWSVDDAMSQAVSSGWSGFDASWLKGSANGSPERINQIANGYQEFLNES